MSPVVYVTSNSLNMLKHSGQKGDRKGTERTSANFHVSKNAFTEKVKKKKTHTKGNEQMKKCHNLDVH